MKSSLVPSLAMVFFLGQAAAVEVEKPPLDAPEAAYWHAESRTWLVSSLGGGLSIARDGNGWLARYDDQGRLLDARWVEGMDAPTGIAAVGNLVYVADRGGLHEIDARQAKILRTIEIPGSKVLNDVAAAPNGDLFVSDFEANRIYRLGRDRTPEIWLESESLENPNGLIVDGEHLVIATWGPMTDRATFAVRQPGKILRADLRSRELAPLGRGDRIASFDGIVKVGEDYFATDWPNGRLLRISKDGAAHEVLAGLHQLADLGHDPASRTIAMPVMGDDRLVFLRLGALE